MKQAWEIVHWPNGKRVQLCDSQEIAEKLLPCHGKGHIIREIWFHDDGSLSHYWETHNNNKSKWKKKTTR